MKKTNKKQVAAWVLSLLPLAMIAAVYRRLPPQYQFIRKRGMTLPR